MEPFDTYFQVKPFLQYHRVITMELFMENLAPYIWPPGKRKGQNLRSVSRITSLGGSESH